MSFSDGQPDSKSTMSGRQVVTGLSRQPGKVRMEVPGRTGLHTAEESGYLHIAGVLLCLASSQSLSHLQLFWHLPDGGFCHPVVIILAAIRGRELLPVALDFWLDGSGAWRLSLNLLRREI